MPESRASRVPAPALIVGLHAIVFACLAWWSWRKWPDPLVDFGRELYLPWQITRGRVLYRDLASLFGPLSPYANALWFRLFGVSLMTLAVVNMAILGVMVAGIHHLVRRATDRATATAASLTTLLLFGFSQYVIVGNYNFVTPYSHDATHGLALGVAMLVCLDHGLARNRRGLLALGGVCLGLVALTKPETALAAAVGAVAALAAAASIDDGARRGRLGQIASFLIPAVAPALCFFAYFRGRMPALEALRAVGGAWTSTLGTTIAASPFYVRGMGLDEPIANLARSMLAFAGFAAFMIAAAAISVWEAATGRRRFVRAGRVGLLAVVILAVPWGSVPRALPLIALSALVAAVVSFRRVRHDRTLALRHVTLLSWTAFALVLLAKMGLNARLVHYGFCLALPATVVAVATIGALIPGHLDAWRPGAGSGFRQMAWWTLAAAIAPYLGLSHGWYAAKTRPIASGADRFYVSADGLAGTALQEALTTLARAAGPDATIAVLPEGVMLNYLLRRTSPLRVVTAMPPEMLAFGEDDLTRSLEASPPDFVVLFDKDASEYGYPRFGADPRYGEAVVRWVRARYRRLAAVGTAGAGEPPLVEILERVTPTASLSPSRSSG